MTSRDVTPVASPAVMPVTHLVWRPAVAIVDGRLTAVRQSAPTPAARR